MTNQSFDKINCRESFYNIFIIFMPIVMEGNSITIIAVYSGCSNYRATKITPNVFDDCFGIRKIRFGIDTGRQSDRKMMELKGEKKA